MNNKDDRGYTIAGADLPMHEQLAKRLTHIWVNGFMPPAVKFATNTVTGERGSRKPKDTDDRNMNRLEVVMGELLGARPRSVDTEQLYETAVRRSHSMLRDVRSAASIANSSYPVADGEIADAVRRMDNAYVKRGQQLQRYATEYGRIGLDTGRLISLAREGGVSKDAITKAMAGYADAYRPRTEDLRTIFERGEQAEGKGLERLKEMREALDARPNLLPLTP